MARRTGRQPAQRRRADPLSPWPFAGMAWLAGMAFVDLFSYQFLPGWQVAALLASWVVLFVLACRWFSAVPRRALVAPALATALWLGAVLLAL